MEEQKQTISKIQEIRKIHPKAFARWTEDEDKALLEEYERHNQNPEANLEMFLQGIGSQFGRKPNGIRGRLAKFFPDIPGWDYEGQKKRDEERKNRPAKEAELKQENEPLEKPEFNFSFSGNPAATQALEIMENSRQNLFLTGEAGTGKSTLLKYFRQSTEKNLVVLAPTGVAALNVEGQTIHSFCAFGPDISLQKVKKLAPFSPKFKLLQTLDVVVIDEISMVRADLLDCVDKFLRLNGPMPSLPFGGLQMLFIGDLYQLPPVEKNFGSEGLLIKEYDSPYFFDSRAFKSADFKFIELKTIYRQKEASFIELLNAVRNNAVNQEHLTSLNQRVQEESEEFSYEDFAIYLTPINRRAREVNDYFLSQIESSPKKYIGNSWGTFENRELPTDLELEVKVGAQVMMLNNDQRKRWVNGTMAKVLGFKEIKEENFRKELILLELETGETVEVEPHTWEMFQFILDKGTQKVDSKTTGTFTQYPFKLAWAVTIHKAQGKTFDKVYIDLSSGTFAHGQLYVALSRCRTLQGLYLKRPIVAKDIILDERIVKFLQNFSKIES